jgi:hypothetical protein
VTPWKQPVAPAAIYHTGWTPYSSVMEEAPVFVGGSVAQHVTFVVSLCRYQHHDLRLAAVHYATWSVVHLALHTIAFTLFGPPGVIALAALLTAWAMRMDFGIGVAFGLMQAIYARAAIALAPTIALSSGPKIGLALLAMVAAIVVEARSHVWLQGYPPRPPKRAVATLPKRQKVAFVPYFVFTFGLFFMTLDLAMRLLGYRSALHRCANAITAEWQQQALADSGESAA